MNAALTPSTLPTAAARCRFCGQALRTSFVDLGMSPPCQTHIEPQQLNHMEPFYPLHAWVCEKCFLVQLEEYVAPASIFSEYAYFSSYADSWVEHARRYTLLMRDRLKLTSNSLVMEIASNDGYLLQYFQKRGIKVLGVEPSANVALIAEGKGVPTLVKFFGVKTATFISQSLSDGADCEHLGEVRPVLARSVDVERRIEVGGADGVADGVGFDRVGLQQDGHRVDTGRRVPGDL